jgi:hypothetical protein
MAAAVAAGRPPLGGGATPAADAPLDDALEARLARKRAFADFLEFVDPSDGWSLAEQIARDMVEHSPKTGEAVALRTSRLNVQVHRLRAWNPALAQELIDKPAEVLPGFEDAVRDFALASPQLAKLLPANGKDAEIRVGLLGDFGAAEVSPRELSSRQLGKLVKVYGIVTRCSLVRPKIVRSVHYCPATGLTSSKEYRDVTALTGLPTGEFLCVVLRRARARASFFGRAPRLALSRRAKKDKSPLSPLPRFSPQPLELPPHTPHTLFFSLKNTKPTRKPNPNEKPEKKHNRRLLPDARQRRQPAGHRVRTLPLP